MTKVEDSVIKEKGEMEVGDQIVLSIKTKLHLSYEALEEITMNLSQKRTETQKDRLEVLFALKSENINENYQIFDKFSRQCKDKYDEKINKSIWEEYNPIKKDRIMYNRLLYLLRIDNLEKYGEVIKKYKIFRDRDIKYDNTLEIEQEYLIRNNEDESFKFIEEYKNNEKCKNLLIKSTYGTGKTQLLLNMCGDNKRILYISYRITLTENICGTFKDLNFKSYIEDIDHDRVICQLDSILKIYNPIFDMVIIDESESILNHLSSSTIYDKKGIFNRLAGICMCAKKVIALDGDISNRTKRFMNSINNETMYLKNSIKKDMKHFIYHKKEEKFAEKIKTDVESGKNICIISMSEEYANKYYEIYKNKYKTVKYTGKSDDSLKKMLCDVNNVWKNYQIIIFTPVIESGLDFNKDHFDKMYIILSGNSTSQRGLIQMMHRIRKIKENIVNCYLNNIQPYETTAGSYNFQEILTFYDSTGLLNMNKKFYINENNEVVFKSSDNITLFNVIAVYNKVEEFNKKPQIFLPILLKFLKEKGHTYEFFEDNDSKKIPSKKSDIVKMKLLDAKKITQEEYDKLKKKQNKNDLSEEQKYEIIKFLLEESFKIKFDNIDIINKYFRKIQSINNAKMLFGYGKNNIDDKDIFGYDCIKTIEIIKNILNLIGIDYKKLLVENIQLTHDEFIKDIIKIESFIEKNRIILGLRKYIKIKNSRQLLGIFKTLLGNYGIEYDLKYKKKNEGSKRVSLFDKYIFFIDPVIKNVIENDIL